TPGADSADRTDLPIGTNRPRPTSRSTTGRPPHAASIRLEGSFHRREAAPPCALPRRQPSPVAPLCFSKGQPMSRQRSDRRKRRKGLMERPHPDGGQQARDSYIEELRRVVRSALCTLRPDVVQAVLDRIANSDARLWEVIKGINLGPDGEAM